jgi:hypothetical protein
MSGNSCETPFSQGQPRKTIATRSLVYAGIVLLAIAAFCVLSSVVGMAWTVEQVSRGADVPRAQDVALGISRASIPMRFAAPTALIGLVLIVVGVVRRKPLPNSTR